MIKVPHSIYGTYESGRVCCRLFVIFFVCTYMYINNSVYIELLYVLFYFVFLCSIWFVFVLFIKKKICKIYLLFYRKLSVKSIYLWPILIVLGWLEGWNSMPTLSKPQTGNNFQEIWHGFRFPMASGSDCQSQIFCGNSIKHNLLKFSLIRLKNNSIKTPLSLPHINVIIQ